jgi:nucleotide-binding universal stress UspA family protein
VPEQAVSTQTPEPIRRILFPTDFSPASENAFGYAERLAASTGADLLILHVFRIADVWSAAGELPEADEQTKRKLQDVRPAAPDVRVEHIAHGGPPGEVICWLAQEHQCDQIVMGTHGHTGLAHLLLGSVAEYVVRHAPCPVLTVRQRSPKEKPLQEPVVYVPMPPVM